MKTPINSEPSQRSVAGELATRLLRTSIAVFAVLLAFVSVALQAQNAGDAARSFQEGRYDDALEIYRQLSLENPEDPRLIYNAGVAAYKAGHLTEAIEQFEMASLSQDLDIQQQAHYNLANTLYRAGESTDDFEQKAAAWKQAVQRYQNALTINEADNLAQDNLDFVKKRIEELEQQQQEQQQQQDQNQDQDGEDEDSEQQQSPDSNSDQEQDQENQDSSDQQQNEQDQQQQNQEQQQQEQNGDQEQEQQEQGDQENQQQEPSEAEPSEQNPDSKEAPDAQQMQEGKMTPEQAKQLLDAERDQAKAMIFRPPEDKKAKNRRFKDW